MKKQLGFTAVEGLLILVAVGIVGFAGWYVYNANNKTQDSYANADQSNSSTANIKKKAAAKDSTADWVSYSSKDGQYSIKYPKTWATATNQDQCTTGIFLLGTNSSSVGSCGSSNLGQVSVSSVSGNEKIQNELSSSASGSGELGFSGITTTSVTVNGVKGEKQSGTATGADVQGPTSLPKDTKVVIYTFITNNRTYVLRYASGDYNGNVFADGLNDFDTMVTKTLKFSAS